MYIFPSWRIKRYPFLKKNEAWWTVLVLDLFAIPGTVIAGKLGRRIKLITPNGVSSISFVIFYLGIALLFIHPDKYIYPTFCFFLCSVVDAMDGKLARLRGEKSQLGIIVDAFFDMLNHGLGLMLVGVALSVKVGSPYPLIVILPYSLYLGVMHVNHISNTIICAVPSTLEEVSVEASNKTKWQLFCDKRGLGYNIYGDVEVIYIVILLIGINLQSPSIFLLIGIYLNCVIQICKKLRMIKSLRK